MTDEEKATQKTEVTFPLNNAEGVMPRRFFDHLGRTWELTEDRELRLAPPKTEKPYWDIRLTRDDRDALLALTCNSPFPWDDELVESLLGPPHGHYLD